MSDWPVDPARVALGDLDDDERAVADRMMSDPAFRAEVREFERLAARLDAIGDDAWSTDEAPMLDPALFAPAPAVYVERPAPVRHSWYTRRWMPALVGAVGSLIIVVLAITSMIGGDDVRTVALQPVGDTPGTATIEIAPHEMHLVAHGLPPSARDTHYEAWLGRTDGSMISVGTFTVGADGNVDGRMELTVDPSEFTAVDVSLEPNDGNPAHSQTSVFHATIPG